MSTRVLAVGECLLELREETPTRLHLGVAGDTYNTAVYLRRVADRLGVEAEVGYLTGLGDDHYSARMRAAWREQRVLDHSVTIAGGQPGVYAVATDQLGERSFTYWRSTSAAAQLFSTPDWVEGVDGELIHFSGITLQVMDERTRGAFLARLGQLRAAGATISFDTNYRPALWISAEVARSAFDAAAAVSDIVLATDADEEDLRGLSAGEVIGHYRGLGCTEVICKLGPDGALVAAHGEPPRHIPAALVSEVVDTTAAGDSFAGGYLAARLAGLSPEQAARVGADLAAVVIQQPGAIIDIAAGRAPAVVTG